MAGVTTSTTLPLVFQAYNTHKAAPKPSATFEPSTITTNFFAAAATSFSRKSAPPPPFTRPNVFGSAVSAPSMATARGAPFSASRVVSWIPSDRACSAVLSEVGTARTSTSSPEAIFCPTRSTVFVLPMAPNGELCRRGGEGGGGG